jgi:stage II sporulation protein AA (anti-sigma F factor antagonist)
LIQWNAKGPDLFIAASGEFDLATAQDLRARLDDVIDSNRSARRVFLDLAAVTFIDSSGLGVLFGRYKRLAARGGSLIITAPRPGVRRAMDLVGLPGLIPVYESKEEALRAQTGGPE